MEEIQGNSERQEVSALAALGWSQRKRYCSSASLVTESRGLDVCVSPFLRKALQSCVGTAQYLWKRSDDWQKCCSGKNGAELALAAELSLGLWWSPAIPATGHVVCLGAPNSLRMPEEKLLLLYDFLLPVTAGTTGTVQEKAGSAHENVFCLDFCLVIEYSCCW